MRICLVDDDSVQLNYLKEIIDKWGNLNNVQINTTFYMSAEEMLFENNQSYPFDMIILDIQMAKINGLELAKKIRETDKSVIIAFVSGMAVYVFEGYKVQALRYILKPIKNEKVEELLDLVNKKQHKKDSYVILSIAGEHKKVKHDDIIYVESLGHYIIIHTTNEDIDYKCNISDFYEKVKESDFIKTHRSYIINIHHLERITRDTCFMDNKSIVPLSRAMYKYVNESFIKYYKGVDV